MLSGEAVALFKPGTDAGTKVRGNDLRAGVGLEGKADAWFFTPVADASSDLISL